MCTHVYVCVCGWVYCKNRQDAETQNKRTILLVLCAMDIYSVFCNMQEINFKDWATQRSEVFKRSGKHDSCHLQCMQIWDLITHHDVNK